MQLSRHFTLDQLIQSDTARAHGIDNAPPEELLSNLRRLAAGLESVRALLGAELDISSGFRCDELNQAVGGAPSSQHTLGLAADFVCPAFGTPLQISHAVAVSALAYDVLIHEYGRWVHMSFGAAKRCRLLTICEDGAGYREGVLPCGATA